MPGTFYDGGAGLENEEDAENPVELAHCGGVSHGNEHAAARQQLTASVLYSTIIFPETYRLSDN